MRKPLLLLGLLLFVVTVITGCGGGKEQPQAKAEPVNLNIAYMVFNSPAAS